jgi:hypothetical protein
MKITDIIFYFALISVVAFVIGYLVGSLEQAKQDSRPYLQHQAWVESVYRQNENYLKRNQKVERMIK